MKVKIDSRTFVFIFGSIVIMLLGQANWFGLLYGAFIGFALDQAYKDVALPEDIDKGVKNE